LGNDFLPAAISIVTDGLLRATTRLRCATARPARQILADCTRALYGTKRGEKARVDIVGTQNGDGIIVGRLINVKVGREVITLYTPADALEAALDLRRS
jgi:hypothetical protein